MTKAWPFAVDDDRVTVAVQFAGALEEATIVNCDTEEPLTDIDVPTQPVGDEVRLNVPLVLAAGVTVMTVPAVREITNGDAAVPDGDKPFVVVVVAAAVGVAVAVALAVAAAVAGDVGVDDEPPEPEHAETTTAAKSSPGRAACEKRGVFIKHSLEIEKKRRGNLRRPLLVPSLISSTHP